MKKTRKDTAMNNITLPELPPHEEPNVLIRQKKRRLPARLFILLLFIISLSSLALLGIYRLGSGDAFGAISDKFFSFFPADSGFGSVGSVFAPSESSSEADSTTVEPPAESLPVVAPMESDTEKEDSSPSEETTSKDETEKESPEETLPSNAVEIVECSVPENMPTLENLTAREFDLPFLAAMASSVIAPSGRGPLVLILHTRTSEGYLPAGTTHIDPSADSLHTGGIVEVGRILAASLEDGGISVLHITENFDSDGSGKAYIKSRNRIRELLAEYPSIKYVIDLGRGSDVDSDGKLIRTSVKIGERSYAPIRFTVSAGASIPANAVATDLSLALRLRHELSSVCGRISLPVRLADALYSGGLAPRSLKTDIGSEATTLEEAKLSARLFGEIFALMINS